MNLINDLFNWTGESFDINWRRFDGKALVHIAVLKNRIEILEYLVEEKNADVNVADNDENTALHYAVSIEGDEAYKYSKYLIMHSADINKENRNKVNALSLYQKIHYAPLPFTIIDQSDTNFLKYLFNEKKIAFDLNNERFVRTLVESCQEMCEFFIKQGTNINQKDNIGQTPLHYAVFLDKPEICKYLIKQGADINQRNDEGETTLHLATSGGQQEICKYLIEQGADINEKNDKGETALHLATSQGQQEICKYLIEKGADYESEEWRG